MTQSQEKKHVGRPFKLSAEKEGILLNLSLGESSSGVTLSHIIDWHRITTSQEDEHKLLIYKYRNKHYAYIKARKIFGNGQYDHWTIQKEMSVSDGKLAELVKVIA